MLRRRSALLAAVLLPAVAGGFLYQNRATTDGARVLDQVLQLVSTRFVDTVSQGALYEKAARGLVKELNDPYSELFSPKELASFSQQTNGKYAGIGMQIEEQQGAIAISRVFPHTPAEAAGVREGDRIAFVDTLSTRGWKTQQVSDYLIGVPGTKVTVKFQRPGVPELITSTFTRQVIHIPAVPYAIVLDNKIGYVPVQRFNETATEEVQDAVARLSREGVKGVILDMRGNPGGILDQSTAMSNLFLRSGQEIVSVRSRTSDTQRFTTSGDAVFPNVPLTVLTDEGTASASEIVAGALQDHDRALVVGSTSFGKGLVQSIFPLEGGYALKITTGKWYTPSGRSIHRERQLLADGRFVETRPDSLETEAEKKAKPKFNSDAGRTVYGGGGITPDVIVPDDTLTTTEQDLLKSLAPKAQAFVTVLNQYAFELKSSATRNFVVTPAWRTELRRRLTAAGVSFDQRFDAAATALLDRELERRVARLLLGDAGAKQRAMAEDHQLARAVSLLKNARTQQDLFATAPTSTTNTATGSQSAPQR